MGKVCNISVCDDNPCQFGATCVPYSTNGFLCLCPLGKHGLFCEQGNKIIIYKVKVEFSQNFITTSSESNCFKIETCKYNINRY